MPVCDNLGHCSNLKAATRNPGKAARNPDHFWCPGMAFTMDLAGQAAASKLADVAAVTPAVYKKRMRPLKGNTLTPEASCRIPDLARVAEAAEAVPEFRGARSLSQRMQCVTQGRACGYPGKSCRAYLACMHQSLNRLWNQMHGLWLGAAALEASPESRESRRLPTRWVKHPEPSPASAHGSPQYLKLSTRIQRDPRCTSELL